MERSYFFYNLLVMEAELILLTFSRGKFGCPLDDKTILNDVWSNFSCELRSTRFIIKLLYCQK